jgi:hypothetical protein
MEKKLEVVSKDSFKFRCRPVHACGTNIWKNIQFEIDYANKLKEEKKIDRP